MADKSVNLGGSNLFGAGAQLFAQTSSSIHTREMANMLDAAGNVECETGISNMTTYENSFAYCKATPDIKTDLGTLLTKFGVVADSKAPTALTINFSAGEYATVDITGHNHDNNAHAWTTTEYADVSAAVPASSGFGVPNFGLTVGANSTPISASIAFSLNHIDENDAGGEHWVGTNTTFRAEMTLELLGLPTSQTVAAIESNLTGWTVDTNGGNDGNQELDKFTITAHRHFNKV